MEPRAEYRNGVMYVVYDDGEAIPLAEVMKYNNPSMDFDPATGEALGPAAPPAAPSEAEVRAQAALEPERLRAQDTFGDTTMRMAQPYIDSAIGLAANAGRRPTYFSDPLLGGAERVGQYVGDMGLAGLSGLGALTYGGAGLMGEVFGGSPSDERMLARDLAAGIDVAGVGPEARAFGLLSDAVRAERGGVGNMTRGFLANESGAVPLMGGGTAGPTQEAKQAAENAFAAARQAYENNPVNARGAQIIDMLTSGRADEITDEMLDMGDPVLNANLNQYLYRNYDLPMDEASRMERAGQMGFDTGTPLYHGTDKKFQAFNSEKQRDPGFWFTTDSRNAANYADSEGDLLKVFTKTDKETQIPFNEYVLPVVNGNEVDFDDNVQLVKEYLERSGTVTFPNGNFTESGYTRVLDDPRHIRRVEARFDPRLSHLRNLSAGVAPFGLLALQPKEEQY